MNNLEQQLIEAKKALVLPKYIKSANAELCWIGRITRGMDLANEAMASGDSEKANKISLAIKQIEQEMDQCRIEYDKARMAYGADVDVGVCTCVYCQRSQQQEALFLAESRLRRAVFDLTEPDNDGKPLPLSLMSQGTEDAQKEAWKLYMALCNAQSHYQRMCEQFKKAPAWGYVLRAW